MFNLQGSEIIFILLIALVVLGPEKLPGAIRKATQTYAEFRKVTTNFQSEFKSAIDEPLREMRETADLVKDSADPKKIAERAEREAEEAARAEKAEKKAEQSRAVVESMEAAGAASLNAVPDLSLVTDDDLDDDLTDDLTNDDLQIEPADPFADPVPVDADDRDGAIEPSAEESVDEVDRDPGPANEDLDDERDLDVSDEPDIDGAAHGDADEQPQEESA